MQFLNISGHCRHWSTKCNPAMHLPKRMQPCPYIKARECNSQHWATL